MTVVLDLTVPSPFCDQFTRFLVCSCVIIVNFVPPLTTDSSGRIILATPTVVYMHATSMKVTSRSPSSPYFLERISNPMKKYASTIKARIPTTMTTKIVTIMTLSLLILIMERTLSMSHVGVERRIVRVSLDISFLFFCRVDAAG